MNEPGEYWDNVDTLNGAATAELTCSALLFLSVSSTRTTAVSFTLQPPCPGLQARSQMERRPRALRWGQC
jgi:hypothetical protein